jgi:hypothetical protein
MYFMQRKVQIDTPKEETCIEKVGETKQGIAKKQTE